MHIWFKHDNVAAFDVALVVLPSHSSGEVVLRTHFWFLTLTLHSLCVHELWLGEPKLCEWYPLHDKELSRTRLAHGDKALFANRVIGVRNRDGQRITKHRRCLLKPYAVIPLVKAIFLGIPGEPHLWLSGQPSAV